MKHKIHRYGGRNKGDESGMGVSVNQGSLDYMWWPPILLSAEIQKKEFSKKWKSICTNSNGISNCFLFLKSTDLDKRKRQSQSELIPSKPPKIQHL